MHSQSNMMKVPLLVTSILRHAVANNRDQQIITAMPDGSVHAYTYAELDARVRRLASELTRQGFSIGDRIATLAWNTYQHLEIYYASAGIGAICHTINPRLSTEQIAFIIDDACDQVVFYDRSFAALVSALRSRCPSVRHWVALDEHPASRDEAGHASYAGWIARDDAGFDWPCLDEDTACGLCYTSGTTGQPKGALYSHRSTVLHAYASCHPDALGISCHDVVLPLVPMFHVNAWGLPYSALLSGARLVLPGENLQGDALYRLCRQAGVTIAAGVPTVWKGLLEYLQSHSARLDTLERAVIGGAACPPHMIDDLAEQGVLVCHAWGMTEVSPLGSVCRLMPKHMGLDARARTQVLAAQGRPLFGVQFKLTDGNGSDLPNDGLAAGRLMIRGGWVIERYFGASHSALDDGWFDTGDVATIDADGFVRITDRSKDVIKSGGEWISSIEMEGIAMESSDVLLAACVAEPHEKWGERPVLFVVPRADRTVSQEQVLSLYHGRVPRWSVPDRVEVIREMPMTATGKIHKAVLREAMPGRNRVPFEQ
jgi:fatty-acyl-CoA synthase